MNFGNGDVWIGDDRRRWLLRAAAFLVIVGLVGAGFAFGYGRRPEASPIPTPTASPTPVTVRAEAIINGARLFDDDNVQWLTLYDQNRELLGEPLATPRPVADNPNCVPFLYYVVCHSDDITLRHSGWRDIPLALGYGALPQGTPPQLDAPIAPIADQFIASVKAGGRDYLWWVGRAIFPALCSSDECVQVFERAVLTWPNRPNVTARDVTRAPLGRQFGP